MLTFKELREQSGMNMKQFAAHFEIPYRTIQNWEAGVNKCPEYLLKLMKFRLDHKESHGRCWVCEDEDRFNEIVCYIPNDNGGATDVPLNFCPKCGVDMERGGEDGNL